MSKLLTRTKSSVAAKKLAQNLGGKFEPAQASVAGTVVGANLVSVGGQQYRSIGVDGDAGGEAVPFGDEASVPTSARPSRICVQFSSMRSFSFTWLQNTCSTPLRSVAMLG